MSNEKKTCDFFCVCMTDYSEGDEMGLILKKTDF